MFTVIELLSEETMSVEIETLSKNKILHNTAHILTKHIPGVAQHKHL